MFAANTGFSPSAAPSAAPSTAPSAAPSTAPWRGPVAPGLRGLLIGFVDLLIAWQERAMQRHHLAGLDERALKDVGLSQADIAPEIAKPFWRA